MRNAHAYAITNARFYTVIEDRTQAVVERRAHAAPQARTVERQGRSSIQPGVGARHERLPWDSRKTIVNPNGVALPGERRAQITFVA